MEHDLDSFYQYKSGARKGKLHAKCKGCEIAESINWDKKNRQYLNEKIKLRRKTDNNFRKYRISHSVKYQKNNHDHVRLVDRTNQQKHRNTLSDKYVKVVLKKVHGISSQKAIPEIIELKRLQIKHHRAIHGR